MMFCPKCGKEISDESQFCNYCGYEIETDFLDKKNTQNGEIKTAEFKSEALNKPKSARLKKRTLFIMTSGMVVVVFIAIFLYFEVSNNEDKGYFQNTTWGMTFDEVKKILPENSEEKVLGSGLKMLSVDTNQYEGMSLDSNGQGTIIYTFKGDSLSMVTVMLAVHGVKADEYENKLNETFNQKYGDYTINKNGAHEWSSEKSSISLIVDTQDLGSISIRDFVILFVDNSNQKAEV